MTFEKLHQIIEENNIPHDVELQSDSGWECYETEMYGVYYDTEENRLIFTQEGDVSDKWFDKTEFIFQMDLIENVKDANIYQKFIAN